LNAGVSNAYIRIVFVALRFLLMNTARPAETVREAGSSKGEFGPFEPVAGSLAANGDPGESRDA